MKRILVLINPIRVNYSYMFKFSHVLAFHDCIKENIITRK